MSTEEVAAELAKLEEGKKGFVERVSNSYQANMERTKLRIKSVEEYLDALKADYTAKRDEAAQELKEAQLVLASLEAAIAVFTTEVPAPEAPAKRRTRRTQK